MKSEDNRKKVIFCSSMEIGKYVLSNLFEKHWPISNVISLNKEHAAIYSVSAYASVESICKEHGTPVFYPQNYSLKSETDQNNISNMNGDLLIVVGWNRLIPKKILKLFPLGAIGIHGSSELLPKGRGRSPINWSIIEGKKKFMTQLFFLDEGADAGNIIDFFEFNITEMDDCKTVYYKNAMTAVILLERHLFSILNNKVKSQPQIGKPTFYPKRTPADGIIDWSKDCFVIYNLVRAVTHPYPGAFGHIGKNKVMIWRAHPFDFKIDDSNKAPGEVVEVFPDKNFLVKTGNGLLLVTEYEFNSMENGSKDIRKGDYFEKL